MVALLFAVGIPICAWCWYHAKTHIGVATLLSTGIPLLSTGLSFYMQWRFGHLEQA